MNKVNIIVKVYQKEKIIFQGSFNQLPITIGKKNDNNIFFTHLPWLKPHHLIVDFDIERDEYFIKSSTSIKEIIYNKSFQQILYFTESIEMNIQDLSFNISLKKKKSSLNKTQVLVNPKTDPSPDILTNILPKDELKKTLQDKNYTSPHSLLDTKNISEKENKTNDEVINSKTVFGVSIADLEKEEINNLQDELSLKTNTQIEINADTQTEIPNINTNTLTDTPDTLKTSTRTLINKYFFKSKLNKNQNENQSPETSNYIHPESIENKKIHSKIISQTDSVVVQKSEINKPSYPWEILLIFLIIVSGVYYFYDKSWLNLLTNNKVNTEVNQVLNVSESKSKQNNRNFINQKKKTRPKSEPKTIVRPITVIANTNSTKEVTKDKLVEPNIDNKDKTDKKNQSLQQKEQTNASLNTLGNKKAIDKKEIKNKTVGLLTKNNNKIGLDLKTSKNRVSDNDNTNPENKENVLPAQSKSKLNSISNSIKNKVSEKTNLEIKTKVSLPESKTITKTITASNQKPIPPTYKDNNTKKTIGTKNEFDNLEKKKNNVNKEFKESEKVNHNLVKSNNIKNKENMTPEKTSNFVKNEAKNNSDKNREVSSINKSEDFKITIASAINKLSEEGLSKQDLNKSILKNTKNLKKCFQYLPELKLLDNIIIAFEIKINKKGYIVQFKGTSDRTQLNQCVENAFQQVPFPESISSSHFKANLKIKKKP